MKTRKNPYLAAAMVSGLLLPVVHAGVAPYSSADANTLHLYHLDETAAPLADTGTGTVYDLTTVTATPAAPSFTGFGSALSYTVITNAALAGDVPQANFQGADGAFTYELVVNPGAITGTNTLLARDHTTGGPNRRSFIFRINGSNIDFINTGNAAVQTVTVPLPTSGAHAFTAGQWFHIAVAYNGTANTAGNISFYWTALNSGAIQANLLGTFNLANDVGSIGGNSPFTVGNRDGAANALVGNKIDEVRVSNIARGPGEFIFFDSADTDNDTLLDSWEVLNFRANEFETVAEILAKQTGTGNPDGDAFDNFTEMNAGSDPNNPLSVPSDKDADGLLDSWEITHFTNIAAQDGGGDPDGDYATNEEEENAGTDPSGVDGFTSFPDTEGGTGDGLSDAWEMTFFSSLAEIASGDPDLDLYTNAEEYTLLTNPNDQLSAPDGDSDGLNDGWEALYFFVNGDDRPTLLAKQEGAGDPDNDKYSNELEETALTNPNTAQKPSDTDADGLIDSWETAYFFDLSPLPGDLAGDADSATNLQEQNAGSDPTVTASTPTDIDGDGILDTAEAFQPYTADSHTLHLWHLDEVDQPAADAGSGALTLTTVNANGRLWAPSFGGFGTGFNPATGRGTPNGGVLSAKPLAGGVADDTTLTYAGANGAFTFEAIVRLDFDPAIAPSSAATMQIFSGENDVLQGAARVWQLRLVPIGGPGNDAGASPLIEFINLHGEVGIQSLSVALPVGADPDAAAQNGWYHVAVAYNGTEATADNLKFFWTLLDPSRTAANEIFSGQLTNDLIASTPDLTIGNEGRDNGGSSESFLGVIDEVRVSDIGRSATGFLFGDGDNLDDAWESTYFGDTDETDTGDFDNDGTDNLTEYRLGLIPNSGSSRFAATGGANGLLQWPSLPGVTFKVERSINLSSWVELLPAPVTGAGTTTSYSDPAPPVGTAFYKVTLNP